MTVDNADGGAVPPTTHFAIKPCCLICGRAEIETRKIPEIEIICPCREHTLAATQSCGDFTLRDFGYPVRTVEVDDELFDGYRCNYNEANAGKCKHNNTLCLECFGPDTCEYLAMTRIDGVE